MVLSTNRDDVLAALKQGVESLQESEAWTQYLRMSARFRQYSFQNTMLIALQRPDATRVAGFRSWQALGRNVMKGEKGIRILAPSTRKDDEDNTILTGFRVVSVFDLAQTEGEDLAEMPMALLAGEDCAGHYDALRNVATTWRWGVEEVEDLDGANGSCTHSQRLIRIVADRSPEQRVKTLIHELAHADLHGPDVTMPTGAKEVEAESVAFVVCSALGIDSDSYSFPYIASWASEAGADADVMLRNSATRIKRAANAIIDAMNVTEAT